MQMRRLKEESAEIINKQDMNRTNLQAKDDDDAYEMVQYTWS